MPFSRSSAVNLLRSIYAISGVGGVAGVGQTTSGYTSQQTSSSYGQGDGYRSTTTSQFGGTPFHQVRLALRHYSCVLSIILWKSNFELQASSWISVITLCQGSRQVSGYPVHGQHLQGLIF